MASTQLQPIVSLPSFNLEEPYCHNIWYVRNWDLYKNSTSQSKDYFNSHIGKNNNIDFNICKNPYIREEAKYFMYSFIIMKNATLYTLSQYWRNFKTIFRYVNESLLDKTSIANFTDMDDYNDFLLKRDVRTKKLTTSAGTIIRAKDMAVMPRTTKSPYIQQMNKFINFINEFNDDRPYFEKDIWVLSELPFELQNLESHPIKKLVFSHIPQEKIKVSTKSYVQKRFGSVSLSWLKAQITSMNRFSRWLDTNYPEITSLAQLDRNIMESYIEFLRTSSGLSSKQYSQYLFSLSSFFEISRFLKIKDTPRCILLDKNDYHTKSTVSPHPYTDNEIQQIVEHLKDMDNIQYARMIYAQITIGNRNCELCTLEPNFLSKNEFTGKYRLAIDSTKTTNPYAIPVDDKTAEILLAAYAHSKKLYGDDVKYIFAASKDTCIQKNVLTYALQKLVLKYNITDDVGRPLKIKLHRFRTTKVSKYLQQGLDADVVSLLVGHKVRSSLKYYAKASNTDLQKCLKPLADKFTMLVENIGHIDNLKDINLNKDTVMLSNGICNKPVGTGICEHANQCLSCSMFAPKKEFLYLYMKQLEEVEHSLSAAKTSGNDRLVEYNLSLKSKLEEIIKNCEKE